MPPLRLQKKQGQILEVLLRAYPNGLSKERVHFAVYGDRYDGGPHLHCLESHISRLRVAIADAGYPIAIKSARYIGYWIEEVRR